MSDPGARSQENVDVVRQVYDAAARGDAATVLALYDPNVELDSSPLQVVGWGAGVHRGHDGLRSFFREWHEAWETIDYVYDTDDLIDASGERVISFVSPRGRGRASGAEVETSLGLLWTIRDGTIVRVVWFPSRGEALEAVGLRE